MARFAPLALGPLVELRNGAARLVAAPACGARLLSFAIGATAILRTANASGMPYDFAGFPLIPYSGPIFGGGFRFHTAFYHLGRNVAMEADATHGDAWIRPWDIVANDEASLTLGLASAPEPDGFPFAWSAELVYRVGPRALEIDLALTNSDTRLMPAGLGFHPYFPRPPGTRLSFTHGKVWPPDSPDAVATGPSPAPAGLRFVKPRLLDGLVADRCFDDWSGSATLSYPTHTVRLTATSVFGKLQLYSPWYDAYVCVEPVTNANDGFNRAARGIPGHAVVALPPGETLRGGIRIEARLEEAA